MEKLTKRRGLIIATTMVAAISVSPVLAADTAPTYAGEQKIPQAVTEVLGNQDSILNDSEVFREYEKKVFELTNIERQKAGLELLIWSDTLAESSRAHSKDLAENNMMGHAVSDSSSPTERVGRVGVSTPTSENIAYVAKTPEEVVENWMNSPGHKENILREKIHYLGVGLYYLEGSEYGYYWTQNFTECIPSYDGSDSLAAYEQEFKDMFDRVRTEQGYSTIIWDDDMSNLAKILVEKGWHDDNEERFKLWDSLVGPRAGTNKETRIMPDGQAWNIQMQIQGDIEYLKSLMESTSKYWTNEEERRGIALGLNQETKKYVLAYVSYNESWSQK